MFFFFVTASCDLVDQSPSHTVTPGLSRDLQCTRTQGHGSDALRNPPPALGPPRRTLQNRTPGVPSRLSAETTACCRLRAVCVASLPLPACLRAVPCPSPSLSPLASPPRLIVTLRVASVAAAPPTTHKPPLGARGHPVTRQASPITAQAWAFKLAVVCSIPSHGRCSIAANTSRMPLSQAYTAPDSH